MKRRGWLALVVAAVSACAGAPSVRADEGAAAASPFRPKETADAVLNGENQSWSRHLHDALGLPGRLDLAVEQRTRFERLEGPFRPGEPDSQSPFALRTRLRLGVDGPGPMRLLAEVQDARTYDNGPRDFTGGQIDHADVLQLFVSATGHGLFGAGVRGDVHLGRLTLDLGSRRLVARNRTRNTTNAFDGVHLQLGREDGSWRLRGFLTRPVRIEPDEFDDESTPDRRFSGLAFETAGGPGLRFDAYLLDLRDRQADRRVHTLGARAWRPAKKAKVDFELELMGQSGRVGARDLDAWAAHAEVGYTLAARGAPRLIAQLDVASGTADSGGETSHTFDPLFGARRFDLVATGIYGPFRRSNIVSPGLRVAFAPHPKLKCQVRVRDWKLAEARDAFAGSGLRDPTGAAGRDLGWDLELRAQWAATPWLDVDAGYDHWFKGSYLDRVAGVPSTADADYLYLASRLRF